MDCEEVRKYLDEYSDGALGSRKVKSAIEDHLAECRSCSKELESLKEYKEKIGSFPKVQAPNNFLQMIHERLERPAGFKKILGKFVLPPKIKIPLEVVSLAVAVIALVFVFHVMIPVKRDEGLSSGGDYDGDYYREKTARLRAQEKREEVFGPEKGGGVPLTEEKESKDKQTQPSMKEGDSKAPGRSEQRTVPHDIQFEHEQGRESREIQGSTKEREDVFYAEEPKKIVRQKEITIEKAGYSEEDEETVEQKAMPDMYSLEITLLIKADRSGISKEERKGFDALQMSEAEAERKDERVFKRRSAEGSLEEEVQLQRTSQGTLLTSLEALFESAEGEIVSIEYEEETDLPRSITAKLPLRDIDQFFTGLRRLGDVGDIPDLSSEEEKEILLKISIVF